MLPVTCYLLPADADLFNDGSSDGGKASQSDCSATYQRNIAGCLIFAANYKSNKLPPLELSESPAWLCYWRQVIRLLVCVCLQVERHK